MKVAAEYVSIDSLQEWKDNPRKNNNAIAEVAKSIKRFGFSAPIIARKEDGMIIAGHTRFKAAQRLKLSEVPVRFMDLDVVDSQLLALADNKLNERADWDDELLGSILKELQEEDLTGLGFDDSELNELMNEINEEESSEDYAEEDVEYVYQIMIEDLTEETQRELIEKLEEEGWTCRPLIV